MKDLFDTISAARLAAFALQLGTRLATYSINVTGTGRLVIRIVDGTINGGIVYDYPNGKNASATPTADLTGGRVVIQQSDNRFCAETLSLTATKTKNGFGLQPAKTQCY